MSCCPMCSGQMSKVIYAGVPGRFCERCSLLDGAAAYVPPIVTETVHGPKFEFLIYEGSYWRALCYWLTSWRRGDV